LEFNDFFLLFRRSYDCGGLVWGKMLKVNRKKYLLTIYS